MVASERKTESVKWFNPSKRFGFMECDEAKEIFVHYSAVPIEGIKN